MSSQLCGRKVRKCSDLQRTTKADYWSLEQQSFSLGQPQVPARATIWRSDLVNSITTDFWTESGSRKVVILNCQRKFKATWLYRISSGGVCPHTFRSSQAKKSLRWNKHFSPLFCYWICIMCIDLQYFSIHYALARFYGLFKSAFQSGLFLPFFGTGFNFSSSYNRPVESDQSFIQPTILVSFSSQLDASGKSMSKSVKAITSCYFAAFSNIQPLSVEVPYSHPD